MSITKDEASKLAIVEAAQKLFQQFGLAKTTMEDIAKAIGKSKSSLYYYFATKEDIFEAVVEKEKLNIEKDIVRAINIEHSAAQKLKAFAISKYTALRKRQLLYKIMSESFFDNGICIFNAIKNKYDETEEDILKNIIIYGIEEGSFDPSYKYELDEITRVCTNTLRGMQLDITFGKLNTSATDLIDETVLFISKGLQVK